MLQHSLGEVVHEELDGVLLEVLLEGLGEPQHGLPGAQLGALHHALLVVHEQVGTAGQDVTRLLRVHARDALLAEVRYEALDQLLEVPVWEEKIEHYDVCSLLAEVCYKSFDQLFQVPTENKIR